MTQKERPSSLIKEQRPELKRTFAALKKMLDCITITRSLPLGGVFYA